VGVRRPLSEVQHVVRMGVIMPVSVFMFMMVSMHVFMMVMVLIPLDPGLTLAAAAYRTHALPH